MLQPNEIYGSVLEISAKDLADKGIKAVLIDLDNTLVAYRSYQDPPDSIRNWLASLEQNGLRPFLVTNALPKRANFWKEKFGIDGFGLAAKPWLGFALAIRRLRLKGNQTAVVGDQLFTDILGGNLVGSHTILVKPISPKELGYTRVIRKLERWVIKR